MVDIEQSLTAIKRGCDELLIEAELVARTGAVILVDAFHRFVYGFTDP